MVHRLDKVRSTRSRKRDKCYRENVRGGPILYASNISVPAGGVEIPIIHDDPSIIRDRRR